MLTWNKTLELGDVFHNDKLSFVERRDRIVRRIASSKFYDANDLALDIIIAWMAGAENEDDFEGWWDVFCDWADAHRVWVSTF